MNKAVFLIIVLFIGVIEGAAQGAAGTPADVVILETRLQAVLGGVRDGKLIDAKTAATSMTDQDLFRYYGFNGTNGSEFRVPSAEEPSVPCEAFYGYANNDDAKSGVAFSNNISWNPVPRSVSTISLTSRVYRNIIASFLRQKGIKKPLVKIRQAFRVDLEGDGTDEVIIRAENYSNFGPSAKKGEYSFVILRKVYGNKAQNILLTGDFYPKPIDFGAPNKLDISGIVDLDGDGKMEIVIYGAYYEGVWTEAYGLENRKPKVVLQTGCGV